MSGLLRCFLLLLCALGACGPRPPAAPQAKPVRAWLEAAQTGDVDLFRSAASARSRELLEKSGWDQALTDFAQRLAQECGARGFAGCELAYEGTSEAGKVYLTHRGQRLGSGLRVIYEGTGWKVDES